MKFLHFILWSTIEHVYNNNKQQHDIQNETNKIQKFNIRNETKKIQQYNYEQQKLQ